MGTIILDKSLFFIVIFLAAYLFSFIFTALTIKLAIRIGFVNKPNKIVKTHITPVAYGGGIVIAITFIIALLVLESFGFKIPHLIISILPVVILGVTDDIIRISPSYKFSLQCICVLPFFFFMMLE